MEPTEYAIDRLCHFHGVDYDSRSAIAMSLSPLEWPMVFADQMPDARRQRAEIRSLLSDNGLSFRELTTLDVSQRAMADSMAAAISLNLPVLLNSPDAALIFGYDRREPDTWWWVDRAGTPEIVLESERNTEFALWTDDPAAGVAWIVERGERPAPTEGDQPTWTFLGAVAKSVQGSTDEGVRPYPLSLREFRDRLASTDSLPALASPVVSSDPIGILRAKVAREHLALLLETLIASISDTSLANPLRLAQYHMHGASGALGDMAAALYGTRPDADAIDTLMENWNGIRPRRRALELMTEILKTERMAAEAIQQAVSRRDERAMQSKPSVRRAPGRRP